MDLFDVLRAIALAELQRARILAHQCVRCGGPLKGHGPLLDPVVLAYGQQCGPCHAIEQEARELMEDLKRYNLPPAGDC